jgi:hypothetical protein
VYYEVHDIQLKIVYDTEFCGRADKCDDSDHYDDEKDVGEKEDAEEEENNDDDVCLPLASFSLDATAVHSALCAGQCARMQALPQK